MSTDKRDEKNDWGGARDGAGRPSGTTKAKISVSVDDHIWQSALSRWNGKPSWLVETLLRNYVTEGGPV